MHKIRMALSLVLMISLFVFFLKGLNWLPSVIDRESFRRYASIDLVKKNLRIDRIYMPAYLPEDLHLVWPPAEIYAQKKPFPMIITHFQLRDSTETGLIVHQIDARSDYRPEPKIKFLRIMKESRVLIKDREGVLSTAVCENDTPCTRITWSDGGFYLSVLGKMHQQDLIRLARSMMPDA